MLTSTPGTPTTPRIRSIDLLRGAIMVLMAIDHIRVYSGIPAGGPDPGIFFTRWITHFCVSGFVFFAGTSAFLYGQKLNDRAALSRFLLSRGLWLVILEMTLIRLGWSFNIHLTEFMLAGVIWMLGWCMVLLAALIWLPFRAIWIVGLALIAFQQVFARVPQTWTWWNFIYTISEEAPAGINVLYVLIPWIGVMMTGYGFGRLLLLEPARRDRLCRCIGWGATIGFLVAGTLVILLGPAKPQPFIYRLLGQQKYPASQLYLLMTLGPLILLMPVAGKAKGRLAGALTTFGKVPLFYYILHIPLIHLAALGVNAIRSGSTLQDHYTTAPFCGLPENLQWTLPLLYAVFFAVLILLYFACRAYANYKTTHPEKKWLRYL